MLTNYIKLAWRNLVRNRNYSIINILGLTIGLACFMLIMLYVNHEWSYDKFHAEGDQIYRVALERKYPGRSRNYAIIPHSYAQTIKDEINSVEESCRLFYFGGNNFQFKIDDQSFEEASFMWSDSTFFKLFDIKLLQGDPAKVLNLPYQVVLTKSAALKYFGQTDPIGKILHPVNQNQSFVVSGVCDDIPENSHFKFNILISSSSLGPFLQQPNYLGFSAYTYIKLNEHADPEQVEGQLPELVVKYASGQVLNSFGVNYEEYQAQGNGYRYFLQPLHDIHLTSNLEAEMRVAGSKSRVYFFSVIAFMILIIACINFMNLATARSSGRGREVGIRKTLGSNRLSIGIQFLFEALLISFCATLLAWGVTSTVLPYFNELAGKQFILEDILQGRFLLIVLVVSIVTGILAGLYPALSLSSFKPVDVMRGQLIHSRKGINIRNGLVIFQFSISVFLIIASLFVYQQWLFTQNKSLGFEKDGVINLSTTGALDQIESETFKNELLRLPSVIAVGGCSTQPGQGYFGVSFKPNGANEMTTGSGLIVDEGYIECMEMEMVEGRSFSSSFMDTLSIVINESAAREMELDDPIGTRITSTNDFLNTSEGETNNYTIIGVVKDFHFQSLHHIISPLFFVHNQRSLLGPGIDNQISVRISSKDVESTLASMGALWRSMESEVPFSFTFMDQEWANLYEKEITTRRVSSLFTIIAIFIACLGLLALAAFTAEQKMKEIGVRKVLGASSIDIITMLSRNFLQLVLIAILIATPLAWYAIKQWLNNFAYRIPMQVWPFIIGATLALLIAFLTVSFQSYRAARISPIHALKDE